ncbi:hypothetical protein [Candidatus Nardonella dryophthoridicola]|uniref:50S ribosomal protein L25 n=1 Tax=endosymbiont of Rhynchophorus ferrugineus TaxID=1972133 RepID=A0A2Z5TIJ0_9GAMM|nr:hypothetical protein [Candidatus Nardonella dryophthoridicola]QTJ62828.1 hypothetical protein JRY34_00825 [Candidatus Nardonella dryophthoridicola]BBA85072.1 50S ribosomal protein L25 [endosymbiont of Rhynchophorus ferrugineus]
MEKYNNLNNKNIIEYIIRKKSGKINNYNYRKNKYIPAIIYSKNINLKINIKNKFHENIKKIYNNNLKKIYLIDKKNKKKIIVYIKEIQINPIKNNIIHIDFIKY